MQVQNSIKFKTTNLLTNLSVGLIITIALIGIVLLILSRFQVNSYLVTGIILAAGITFSFIVSYVSNDETALSADDKHLYFSTETSLIYNIKEKTLKKDDIRCFQLTATKLYDYLIFYFFDKKPYIILLGRNNIQFSEEIEQMLKAEGIRSLKDSKFISDFSFSEVFKKSFSDHILFGITLILIQVSIILFYKFILNKIYQITGVNMVISAILIWAIYRAYFKKKWATNIQWGTIFFGCYLTTFFSLILIGLCSKPIHTIISKSIHVKNITEIQSWKSERFFTVDEFNFKRNYVGFYQSHSKNNKSGTWTIKNVFSVPFKNQNLEGEGYSNWASLSFEHTFKKASQQQLFKFKKSDFEKFKSTIDGNINCFELIHHDPDGVLKDKLSLRSVESTWKHVLPLYIFKPITDSFEDYKQKKIKFLSFFIMGMILLSGLNGFIYAKSR